MYTKVSTEFEAADYSDFGREKVALFSKTDSDVTIGATPYRVIAPFGSTLTVSLAHITTVRALIIWNEDPTNFVTLTYKSAGGVAVVQTQKILPGRHVNLPDVTAGAASTFTLTADTAPCFCTYIVTGL